MSSLYKRHALVWLSERGWQEARSNAAATLTPEHRDVLQRWQSNDWPVVVRRRDADSSADAVCLGLAMPPDADGIKLRLPLRVSMSQVRAVRAPLAIADVLAHVMPQWRDALRQLHDEATTQGLSIGVFGSLALQALTGQTYLRPGSDIDVLFAPGNIAQLQRGTALLKRYAQLLPLDGEVEFPDGAAVSWKEWMQTCQQADNRVLVKRSSDVALVRVGDLTALLSIGQDIRQDTKQYTKQESTACPA